MNFIDDLVNHLPEDTQESPAPPALTVAARRSVAGIELRPTVFKSEGMGRERKVRGFHSYDSGKGKASGRGPPRAAMAEAMGARGELGSGREREGCELGLVEGVTGVLTVKGIELR